MAIDLNKSNPIRSHIEDAEQKTDRIRSELQKRIREVVSYLFPKAQITAREARVGDVYGARGNSLSIVLTPLDRAGLWIDHAERGNAEGDVFTLWQAAQGLSDFQSTLAEIEAWLGGSFTPAQKRHTERREKQKADKEPDIKKVQEKEYVYKDVQGRKICSVFRYRLYTEDGGPVLDDKTGKQKKTFSIYRHSDKEWKAPDPRPLYNLPEFYNAADVVFVEGEKCVDALASVGIEATTASGGSNTKLEHTDWTPLAGKNVYLWPDNDPVGSDYMKSVAEHLVKLGCNVFFIPPPEGVAPKWDAADAVEEGRDIPEILAGAQFTGGIGLARVKWRDVSYQYEPEILEDLLPRTGLATLYGPSTGGKSFVVLDLCYRIARGEEIFSKQTEPCGILYCAFEGYDGLKKRIQAIKNNRNVPDIEFEMVDSPWNICNADDWKAFAETVDFFGADFKARGTRLGILIIDTLTNATAGSDTNSQAEVTAAMKRLKRLAQDMGLLVFCVGHTGKETTRGMVGSFAYKSEADAFLECQIDREEETGRVTRRALYVDKVKDGASGFILAEYALQVVTVGVKPNGKEVTTCLVNWSLPPSPEAPKTESEKLIEYSAIILGMLNKGAMTGAEIATALRVSRTRASEILAFMGRSGHIFSETIGSKKIWKVAKPETEKN